MKQKIYNFISSEWFLYGVVAPVVFAIVAAIGGIGE